MYSIVHNTLQWNVVWFSGAATVDVVDFAADRWVKVEELYYIIIW